MRDCDYCNREERVATADNPIGITWLDNDQKWICDSCLKRKMKWVTRFDD